MGKINSLETPTPTDELNETVRTSNTKVNVTSLHGLPTEEESIQGESVQKDIELQSISNIENQDKEYNFILKHPSILHGTVFIPFPSVNSPTKLELKLGIIELDPSSPNSKGLLEFLKKEGWIDLSKLRPNPNQISESKRPERKIKSWVLKIPNADDQRKIIGTTGAVLPDGSHQLLEIRDNLVNVDSFDLAEVLVRSGFLLAEKIYE